MNTILLILGILGLGAVAIAVYVFTVAARSYVSDDQAESVVNIEAAEMPPRTSYAPRSNQDRRQFTGNLSFPLSLPDGKVVEFDRRQRAERRAAP